MPFNTRQVSFAGLLIAAMISGLGFGVMIPLLPSYALAFDATGWEVGLLFSSFAIGQAGGEAFWGRLSDRIGRKPVILTALLLSVVGCAFTAFAPSLILLMFSRTICGIAAGNTGAAQGLLIDTTPPEQLASRLATFGACRSIGFILGPAMGGLLAGDDPGRAELGRLFLIAAALSALGALVVWLCVERAAPKAPQRRAKGENTQFTPAAIKLIAINVVLMGAFAGIESIFGLWTEFRFDWSPRELGITFGLAGAIGAVMQMAVTGWLVRRLGERRVLVIGLAVAAVMLSLQGAAPAGWVLILMVMVVAMSMGLCMPTAGVLLSREARPGAEGELMGAGMSAAAIAAIIGPLCAGVLFGIAPTSPFVVGGLLVASALLLTGAPKAKPQTSAPAATD